MKSDLDWPRLALTFAIIALFTYALMLHYSNGLEETLKNITMLAIGFWLGSAKTNEQATANTGKAFDAIKAAQEAMPAVVEAGGAQQVADAAQQEADDIKKGNDDGAAVRPPLNP